MGGETYSEEHCSVFCRIFLTLSADNHFGTIYIYIYIPHQMGSARVHSMYIARRSCAKAELIHAALY